MRLSSLLMFAGIKAPHINGIIGFSDHCFAFYTSFNSNFTNIYGVHKGLVSGLVSYISGLYGNKVF